MPGGSELPGPWSWAIAMPRRNVIIVRLACTCVRVVRRPTSRGAATHSVKDLLNGHLGCGLVPFARVTIVPGQRILDAPTQFGPVHG